MGIGISNYRSRYSAPAMASWQNISNAMVIGDSENPETAYENLYARTDMGTLSATNRRTLILLPGTYTRTTTLTLRDYVDIKGIGAFPEDTVIVCSGSGVAAVTQTCSDVRLSNFTIWTTANASGSYGLLINAATNNNASKYDNMKFKGPGTDGTNSDNYNNGVHGLSDLGGTWRWCEGEAYSWRVAVNKSLTATMWFCTAGDRSYQGDGDGTGGTGTLSGNMYYCIGGNTSFAGCTTFASGISGYLEGCSAGYDSYAIGANFSGKAVRCYGGKNSFAGYAGSGTAYGTFSGVAIDCVAEGGCSFGMGAAGCVQSGEIIRCVLGDWTINQGVTKASISTVTDASAYATFTQTFGDAEVNNDMIFTAKQKSRIGNTYRLYFTVGTSAAIIYNPITVAGERIESITIRRKNDGTTTADALKTLIEADADVNALIGVTFSGTGAATIAGTGEFGPDYLSGGFGKPRFVGNCPPVPIHCTADTTVYPFDSGAVYDNFGASGAITFTLPAAIAGLSFTFADVVDTATVDLNIDCVGTDNFVKPDGTAMADGEQYQSENDTFAKITATCYVDGIWQLENSTGTWVEESP